MENNNLYLILILTLFSSPINFSGVHGMRTVPRILMEDGARLPLSELGSGNYIVKVGFGTPTREFNLIFDTGSDITWLKCGPTDYQPSSSSTFINVTDHNFNFNVSYGDKSTASGYYIKDTLTVSSTNVFPNFILGCRTSPDDFGSSADGLLGLGQGDSPVSFMSQTSTHFAEVFCYCLPRKDTSSGYVLFGMKALKACNTISLYTPLKHYQNTKPYFYYVNLVGLTIGDIRIDISSSSKTIMDSGTPISRLPSTVYSSLRSEFVKFMSELSYSPAQRAGILDTCYKIDEGFEVDKVPKIGLSFENIELDLDPSALITEEDDSRVCLAFATNEDAVDGLIIIGNHQQRTLNVLYDIQENKVGIGAGDC